jgi:hypothetical protein
MIELNKIKNNFMIATKSKIVFIFLMLINAPLYSIDTLKFVRNDTLMFVGNNVLINNMVSYKQYSDMELIDENLNFTGYLIIQLDSNTLYTRSVNTDYKENDSSINNKNVSPFLYELNTTIFWVHYLEDIDVDSNRYYYELPYLLTSYGSEAFRLGHRDILSALLNYLYIFNNNYKRSRIPEERVDVCYLYQGFQAIRTNHLVDKPILVRKDENVKYIIYYTHFFAATVKYKSTGRKIFVPMSVLREYKSIDENSYVHYSYSQYNGMIKNFGFKRIFPPVKIVNEY